MKKENKDNGRLQNQNMQRVENLATLTGMVAVFLFVATIIVIYFFPPQPPANIEAPILPTITSMPTPTPTLTPTPTGTPTPMVELLSVAYLQPGAGCQANIKARVNGSAVSGSFHVWNANDPPTGEVSPPTVLQAGASDDNLVTLGGPDPKYYTHEVWFEYNGASSNRLTGLICPGLTPVP
jgi:hypothetical protein